MNLTVVVAGFPAMANALRASGRFAEVVSVESTSQLRDALASGLLSGGVEGKIFLFADTTRVDTKVTLQQLLQKLVAMGAPAVIVGTSLAGRDLLGAVPAAGLLEGPFSVNQVLGALSGLRGATALEPVAPAANLPIEIPDLAGVQAPAATPAPTVASSVPAPMPAAPSMPAPASPFGAPAASEQPPAPRTSASPFGATSAPEAPEAPAAVMPAPAASSAAGLPSPFQPSPSAPPQAAPFQATPFPTPAADPAPAAPFQPAPAAPATAAPSMGAAPFQAAPPQPAQLPPTQFPTEAAAQPSPFQSAEAGASASPFGAPGAADPFTQPPASTGSPFSTVPGGEPAGAAFGAQPAWAVQEVAAPASRAGAAPVEKPQRRGIVITVTAPKGGTGKSTLSLNLAAYLGLRLRGTGRNVCIVDSNVQQADTGKYLDAYHPNIEGVLKDVSAIHPDRISNYLLHRPDLNLSALLGPGTPQNANPLYFTGKRYAQIVQALKPNYDYIILDTPVAELYHEIFRDCALPLADFIVTTITPNIATLMNTDGWLRQVTAPISAGGMGVDRAKVGVVLNRAQEDVGMDEEDVRRELGEWRFLGSIPETKEWQRCNNDGELVATKNYHELNEAFAVVLAAATGEELLSTTPASLQTGGAGPEALRALWKRLTGRKG